MDFLLGKTINTNSNHKYKVKWFYLHTISLVQQVSLTPSERLFFNLSYIGTTNEKGRSWKYDFTFNHIGEQRIPSTQDNPQHYRLPNISERLNLINTQITRVFSKSFQLYLGVENLTNYRQENTIISPDDPFGDYFDATYVYGPIFGRMTYVGLRYYIK